MGGGGGIRVENSSRERAGRLPIGFYVVKYTIMSLYREIIPEYYTQVINHYLTCNEIPLNTGILRLPDSSAGHLYL